MKLSPVDLWTLKLSVEEGIRVSYLAALRRCATEGLATFDAKRGTLALTEAGRIALADLESA